MRVYYNSYVFLPLLYLQLPFVSTNPLVLTKCMCPCYYRKLRNNLPGGVGAVRIVEFPLVPYTPGASLSEAPGVLPVGKAKMCCCAPSPSY